MMKITRQPTILNAKCSTEQKTETDPLLKLRFSIVTRPIDWYYIMMQQIKQSTINYINKTNGGDRRKI